MGYIKNFNELATTPQRKIVLDIIESAISSIQPDKVISDVFRVMDNELKISDQTLNLVDFNRVFLISFGKGSARISKIIEDKFGDKLTEGYVIDVDSQRLNLSRGSTSKVQYVQGTHPLPSQTNLDFTKKVVERFENQLSERDLVLVVVTGGGSALFELPIEGKTLDDLLKLNSELLKSGKTIEQMNIERKKLSQVKAGGLARILKPAKVMGLIFSDVPGNNISTIASGPTDDPSAENRIMLSNKTALDAMQIKAAELNLQSFIYFDAVEGEAKIVGAELLKVAKPNSILLAGGETTVTVQNKNGKGGRNQELVLSALINNETILSNVTIASFDSDGWDNTEFAGAIGDTQTVQSARKLNLDLQKYLEENNSFEFFEKVGDGIITGRLPSNIADLMIAYKF